MKKLEMELHNEEFDVEVQYCNNSSCKYDCTTSTTDYCNAHFSSSF